MRFDLTFKPFDRSECRLMGANKYRGRDLKAQHDKTTSEKR